MEKEIIELLKENNELLKKLISQNEQYRKEKRDSMTISGDKLKLMLGRTWNNKSDRNGDDAIY